MISTGTLIQASDFVEKVYLGIFNNDMVRLLEVSELQKPSLTTTLYNPGNPTATLPN